MCTPITLCRMSTLRRPRRGAINCSIEQPFDETAQTGTGEPSSCPYRPDVALASIWYRLYRTGASTAAWKKAMTSAERQRQYRDRLLETLAAATKGDRAVARLNARIQELETALKQERARRREPESDASTLSLTARQKLDAAIRQEKRKLASEFHQYIRDEVRKRPGRVLIKSRLVTAIFQCPLWPALRT